MIVKILTIEELKKMGIDYYLYHNGDYEFRDDTGLHLIRDGKDLLKGKNATRCFSYHNGDYEFRDEAGLHLIEKLII